jgi:hypothetical protein
MDRLVTRRVVFLVLRVRIGGSGGGSPPIGL